MGLLSAELEEKSEVIYRLESGIGETHQAWKQSEAAVQDIKFLYDTVNSKVSGLIDQVERMKEQEKEYQYEIENWKKACDDMTRRNKIQTEIIAEKEAVIEEQ